MGYFSSAIVRKQEQKLHLKIIIVLFRLQNGCRLTLPKLYVAYNTCIFNGMDIHICTSHQVELVHPWYYLASLACQLHAENNNGLSYHCYKINSCIKESNNVDKFRSEGGSLCSLNVYIHNYK